MIGAFAETELRCQSLALVAKNALVAAATAINSRHSQTFSPTGKDEPFETVAPTPPAFVIVKARRIMVDAAKIPALA